MRQEHVNAIRLVSVKAMNIKKVENTNEKQE